MANLSNELKKILDSLETTIKDKETLENVKVEMFNLYNVFFEELNKMKDLANSRMAEIAESQEKMQSKLEKIEKGIKNIEKDIYMDNESDDDYDLTITCPYCNKEFVITMDELKEEIKCPECNNEIELDWGQGCSGDCCSGGCSHHMEDDEDDDM